jgi:hypothetical protein
LRSLARRFSLALLLSALLVGADALPAMAAAPRFQMPFVCSEYRRASTSHTHKPSRLSIDLNVGYGDADLGSIVVASASGRVHRRKATWGSYGRYITIDHGGGWQTIYAHLASYAVRDGARVQQGDKIGWVGNNKGRFKAHLHYEQRYRGVIQHIRFGGRRIAYRDNPRSVTYKSANNCRANPKAPAVAKPAPPKPAIARMSTLKRNGQARAKMSRRTPSPSTTTLALGRTAATSEAPLLPLVLLIGGSLAVGALHRIRRNVINRS